MPSEPPRTRGHRPAPPIAASDQLLPHSPSERPRPGPSRAASQPASFSRAGTSACSERLPSSRGGQGRRAWPRRTSPRPPCGWTSGGTRQDTPGRRSAAHRRPGGQDRARRCSPRSPPSRQHPAEGPPWWPSARARREPGAHQARAPRRWTGHASPSTKLLRGRRWGRRMRLPGAQPPLPHQAAPAWPGRRSRSRRACTAQAQDPAGVGLHPAGQVRRHRGGRGRRSSSGWPPPPGPPRAAGRSGRCRNMRVHAARRPPWQHRRACWRAGRVEVLQPAAGLEQTGFHLPAVRGHLLPPARPGRPAPASPLPAQ